MRTTARSPDPHEVAAPVAATHAIDQERSAVLGLETGLKDEGALPVMPGDTPLGGRGDLPSPIFGAAEQSGKACRRIEAGESEPIDRAVATDHRRTLAIADKSIVLDPRGHGDLAAGKIVTP